MSAFDLRPSVLKKMVVAAVALVAGWSAQADAAPMVGWNFALSNATANTLAATDQAGAPGYEQTNWNNVLGVGQGPGPVPVALVDNAGNSSGISLTGWTQLNNNSWSMSLDTAPTTADQRLVNSYVAPEASLTFGGLNTFAPGGYSVVVYYGRSGDTALTTNLTVNGNVQSIGYSRANSGYRAKGYMLDGVSGESNYAVFNSLSGNTLTVVMGAGGNFGPSAIQIVAATAAVPEPTGLAMIAVGGLVAMRRRVR